MLLDTQIKSFAVPNSVWENGHEDRPDLPALSLVARDALAIERRANKGVNLRNEQRRYTLCCERMQGITEELAYSNILRPSLVWPVEFANNRPRTRAYLAVVDAIFPWMRTHLSKDEKNRVVYFRFAHVFFPPEHAQPYRDQFDFLKRHVEINSLFDLAAQTANLKGSLSVISPGECEQAFQQRHELVRSLVGQHLGIVDVLEMI